MKKIILSSYDSLKNPFYGGGGAVINYEIAKRLSNRYDITILCGAYPGCTDYTVDSIHYKHIGPRLSHPLLAQLLFSLILPFYAITQTYDLWIENFTPPHSTNFIPLFTKKPVIGLTMMMDAKKFSEKYKLPFYLIERFGLSQYSYFIALNDGLKKAIHDRNPNAVVHVIPGGIDTSVFTFKTKEEPYALFLGRIDLFPKGLDLLIESWKEVVQVNKLKLVIAGSGTERDTEMLKEIIHKNNLESYVELIGKVSGKKKYELIANCMMFLCPSRFETFGLSALEGLAFGKSVIAYDIQGFSWIPDNLIFKVKQGDTHAYSRKVLSVFQKKELRQKVNHSAPIFARKYTWDNVAREYATFIDEIIQ